MTEAYSSPDQPPFLPPQEGPEPAQPSLNLDPAAEGPTMIPPEAVKGSARPLYDRGIQDEVPAIDPSFSDGILQRDPGLEVLRRNVAGTYGVDYVIREWKPSAVTDNPSGPPSPAQQTGEAGVQDAEATDETKAPDITEQNDDPITGDARLAGLEERIAKLETQRYGEGVSDDELDYLGGKIAGTRGELIAELKEQLTRPDLSDERKEELRGSLDGHLAEATYEDYISGRALESAYEGVSPPKEFVAWEGDAGGTLTVEDLEMHAARINALRDSLANDSSDQNWAATGPDLIEAIDESLGDVEEELESAEQLSPEKLAYLGGLQERLGMLRDYYMNGGGIDDADLDDVQRSDQPVVQQDRQSEPTRVFGGLIKLPGWADQLRNGVITVQDWFEEQWKYEQSDTSARTPSSTNQGRKPVAETGPPKHVDYSDANTVVGMKVNEWAARAADGLAARFQRRGG